MIGASGGAGGLADLAEHHRVGAVHEDALDPGVGAAGHVMLADLAIVGGGVGAGGPVTDPRGGGAAVLSLGPR
ncbi:hypothetical protein GCM10020219_063410 [Nonomuraea dietziae]